MHKYFFALIIIFATMPAFSMKKNKSPDNTFLLWLKEMSVVGDETISQVRAHFEMDALSNKATAPLFRKENNKPSSCWMSICNYLRNYGSCGFCKNKKNL